MSIKSLDIIAKKLPQLEPRVHILLAQLLEIGELDWDDFLLRAQGSRTRAYLKEAIACTHKKVHPNSKIGKLVIDVNQEGLFDMLPKGVIHKTHYSDAYDSVNTYIKETRQQRKEKEDARRFFAPFEQETHRLRINIAQHETKLSATTNNPIIHNIFNSFWQENFDAELSKEDINVICFLLPLAHRATSDLELLAGCYSLAMGEPVSIQRRPVEKKAVDKPTTPSLGVAQLGLNTVLGNTVITAPGGRLEVRIGPVHPMRLKLFLEGQPKANLLRWMGRFFVPYECEVNYTIFLKLRHETFVLNNDTCFLGYSTSIT